MKQVIGMIAENWWSVEPFIVTFWQKVGMVPTEHPEVNLEED